MAIHTSKCWCVWHHCKDGPQVEVMEKNHWRCGETRNHPKNATFFEGVQHAFLNSHCSKTRFFHKPQWKWGAKRHHHDTNMWQIPMFSPTRTSQWTWKLMKALGRFPGRFPGCVCWWSPTKSPPLPPSVTAPSTCCTSGAIRVSQEAAWDWSRATKPCRDVKRAAKGCQKLLKRWCPWLNLYS